MNQMDTEKPTTKTTTGAPTQIYIHVVDISGAEAQLRLIRLREKLCQLQKKEMDEGRSPSGEVSADIAALACGICAIEAIMEQK